MNALKFIVLTLAVLLLAACRPVTQQGADVAGGTVPPVAPSEMGGSNAAAALAGTNWMLTTLNDQSPAADTQITLNFGADGSANGSDGCNRFVTSFTLDGDSLTFSPNAAGTMMACPEPAMTQASAFIGALTSTATYAVEGGSLLLRDASGAAVATFAAVSTDLAGTSWEVVSYNNGKQAVVGVLPDVKLTTMFGASGQISGSAGCNNFRGGYTSDGVSTIAIEPLATTMMACLEPAGVMEQEMQFLTALTTAATYSVEGNSLELRTADGALAVSMQAAAGEAAAAGETDVDTQGMDAVTGSITYLPRIALPPDAMVEVTVRNASLADAPSEMTLLANQVFLTDGQQVPLPFTVLYSSADVDERVLYSVGATIRDSAGKLLFVSTTMTPVITQGNPTSDVEVMVEQVK